MLQRLPFSGSSRSSVSSKRDLCCCYAVYFAIFPQKRTRETPERASERHLAPPVPAPHPNGWIALRSRFPFASGNGFVLERELHPATTPLPITALPRRTLGPAPVLEWHGPWLATAATLRPCAEPGRATG